MPKQLVWVKLKTSEGGPPPRLGHTLVEMDKDTFILYGGLENNTKGDGALLPSDKVYNLKITVKGDCVWTAIDCEGDEIPLPRTNHSACKISKNEMFVFGGYYTSKKRFNDCHILVTSSGKISVSLIAGSVYPPFCSFEQKGGLFLSPVSFLTEF